MTGNRGRVSMLTVELKAARTFRFSEVRGGREVGRARLYLIENDLHPELYGLLEDVAVLPEYEGQGIGRDLLEAVIKMATFEKCYKLIATSRDDGTREEVHAWYLRLGLKKYGTEFRMDLK